MDEPSPILLPPLKGEVSATWGDRGCQAWDLIQAGVWLVTDSFLALVCFIQYREWSPGLHMGRDSDRGAFLFHCQCQDNIDSFI